MPRPITATAVLACVTAFAIISILDLTRRNGFASMTSETRGVPGAPLHDAPNEPSLTTFVGIEPIDTVLRILVGFFYPCVNGKHPELSLLCVLFCGQMLPLHTIMMLEGLRSGNKSTCLWLYVIEPTILL